MGDLLTLTALAAWATHVVVCISHEAWLLLVAGAVMVPVGVIHGIGVWLGYF